MTKVATFKMLTNHVLKPQQKTLKNRFLSLFVGRLFPEVSKNLKVQPDYITIYSLKKHKPVLSCFID